MSRIHPEQSLCGALSVGDVKSPEMTPGCGQGQGLIPWDIWGTGLWNIRGAKVHVGWSEGEASCRDIGLGDAAVVGGSGGDGWDGDNRVGSSYHRLRRIQTCPNPALGLTT